MTVKVIIGYSMRQTENISELMPVFKAPSNYTDPGKIKEKVRELEERFKLEAKDMPYTGTFEAVFLYDSANRTPTQWNYDTKKSPVSLRVRNYLMKHFGTGWAENEYDSRNPPFRFIGFNPRRFMKILGLECSAPSIGKPLPLRMWYNNSEHRDMEEAILPKDFKLIDLNLAVHARRPLSADVKEKWDAIVKGWPGPFHDPEKDVKICLELAAQLNFLV